jgi:hypothetical protein
VAGGGCAALVQMAWQGGAGCGWVLEIGLTKNGLQLGHGLLRELGRASQRHYAGKCSTCWVMGTTVSLGSETRA